jgi:hypothetical protein
MFSLTHTKPAKVDSNRHESGDSRRIFANVIEHKKQVDKAWAKWERVMPLTSQPFKTA